MYFLVLFFLGVFLIAPTPALAVPPPDFLINFLPQMLQAFGLAFTFLVASSTIFLQQSKLWLQQLWLKSRWLVAGLICSILIFIGAVSWLGAKFYEKYLQDQAYQTWLAQSKQEAKQTEEIKNKVADLLTKGDVENKPTQVTQSEIGGSSGNGELKNENGNKGNTTTGNGDAVVAATSINKINDAVSKSQISNYFAQNKNTPDLISNQDFKQLLENNSAKPFVLDAREDEENALGRFPNSTHIRMADLKAGDWAKLPKDQTVFVFCWSGIRGKEVADFLRSKEILARYLEKGANGWVDDKGVWDGVIKFVSKYKEERYSRVYLKNEMEDLIKQGVVLVDSRPKEKYLKKHIKESVNIPVMYTASSDLDKVLAQVPAGSKVVTICDDYVNCFDARITGIKLENKGDTFLGRYNEPWAF
jgi:rhodanese-related sulfurtransferase